MFLPFHESLPSLAGMRKPLFASLLTYAHFIEHMLNCHRETSLVLHAIRTVMSYDHDP